MKQTVEKAANDYLNRILESTDFEINFEEDNYDSGARDATLDVTERAFVSGAEWQAKQSPWISVKERLPESSITVFTKGAYGYLICFLSNLGEWETGANINEERLGITHWMPIPSFDEILETNKDDFLSHHIDKVKMEIIRIIANDAQAVTFQTLGQYRSWLMKTINELDYTIPEL